MQDSSFGIIPILEVSDPTSHRYLIILHQKGHWGFPKGHQEEGETDQATAERELVEETGLRGYTLLETEPVIDRYRFVTADQIQVDKTVTYFLARVETGPTGDPPELTIQADELADYRWCTYTEALDLLTFPGSRRVLQECEARLFSDPSVGLTSS